MESFSITFKNCKQDKKLFIKHNRLQFTYFNGKTNQHLIFFVIKKYLIVELIYFDGKTFDLQFFLNHKKNS